MNNISAKENKNVGRKMYFDQLVNSLADNKIKILTGIRQCGKTTILDMFFDELLKEGIPKEYLHVLKLSLFDNQSKYRNPKNLNEYIEANIRADGVNYFFIDEVQECMGFEKVLISAKEKYKNACFFITGSNSKMLSEEIVQKLGDNGYKIEVYPLSFSEYVDFYKSYRQQAISTDELFDHYIEDGGMPDIVKYPATRERIFKGISETIISNDVLNRHTDLNRDILTKIIRYMSSTFGKRFSLGNIVSSLNKQRRKKLSDDEVNHYLECLKESYFLLEAVEPSVGKSLLESNPKEKYYVIDHALGNYLASTSLDRGETLENIVYIQLLRLNTKNITIGRQTENNKEIDFVFDFEGVKHFVQVTQEMDDNNTENREFSAFDSITYKKKQSRYILIKEKYTGKLSAKYADVKVYKLADWLLREKI